MVILPLSLCVILLFLCCLYVKSKEYHYAVFNFGLFLINLTTVVVYYLQK